MFNIERVELENFRSYRGRHCFNLPGESGLYLITGENQHHPRLGSNDIGKSTLLDAVYWCFYGRTTRGLKASDVINWAEHACAVTVRVTVNNEWLEVTRSQASPNKLIVNGTVVSQEQLEKQLRLGPEAFTYAVLLPQFGDSFFDLLPSAKLALFSKIMGLDLWLDKSQEAQKLADEITTLIGEKKLTISKLEGQMETIVEDIEELGLRHQSFDSEKAGIVAGLKKDLENVQYDLKAQQFAEKALVNIAHKLTHISDKECPACGQKIANKDIAALLQNRSDFERELHMHRRRQEARARIGTSIETENKRVNPYAEQIKNKKAAMAACKEKSTKLRAGIESLERDHVAVNYWVTGFKRIRLFIVEQTLRKLEVEVNNNMASLGLTDYRIEFDIERENKAGGITKGFVVMVYSPDHDQPVRWEAWGGGVTHRLRLAGDLGLANLIMEQAGLRNAVEFFDEPSRHLSQEGLLDVAETLHQRALQDSKRIFLVDHQTIDFGDFAGRVLITKSRDGSRLTYS
jgi:DNA repair exonuclease SbcCD ATPase subunit